jgi:hypothetical protein
MLKYLCSQTADLKMTRLDGPMNSQIGLRVSTAVLT